MCFDHIIHTESAPKVYHIVGVGDSVRDKHRKVWHVEV